MLEKMIAYFCAPALAGIKPANLITCYKAKMPHIHQDIEALNGQLNRKDIYLTILCECDKRVLIMVYRKKELRLYLNKQEVKLFLESFHYPKGSLLKQIETLKRRFQTEKIPHEVGVFLGYPICDIYGFILHRDEGCLMTGEWKVYDNVSAAQKLFARYASCRGALVKRVEQGKTLAEIFGAVS